MTRKKIKSNLRPAYWDDACKYLSRKDKVMAGLIKKYKGEGLIRRRNGFHTLVRSIVGQQISVKAADSIWLRLEKLIGKDMNPHEAVKVEAKKLRATGLSQQKVNYFINIANFFVDELEGKLDLLEFDHVELSDRLIEIKGIGQWTVDMFMMFHMHAPDVMPLGDLGVINAIKDLYGLERKSKSSLRAGNKITAKQSKKTKDGSPRSHALPRNDKERKLKAAAKKKLMNDIIKISDKWSPYRTVAAWFLWRHLDPVPIAY